MKRIYNKYKMIILLMPSVILILLTILLSVSNAYYNNKASMPVIHAVVGNKYSSKYDYVLLVYLNNDDNYILTNNIPLIGYEMDSYNCINNSLVTYNDELKSISVLLDKKDFCSIYFNKISPDISINFYILENGNYIIGNPKDNINYTINNKLSRCIDDNSNINNNYSYDSGYINILTSKKLQCDIYLE